jgi:hypothetical protein
VANEAAAFEALGTARDGRVLELLRDGEQTVAELTRRLPVTQSAVSSTCGCSGTPAWSRDRPEGTRRYYRVERDGLAALRAYVDSFWDGALAAFEAHADRSEPRNRAAQNSAAQRAAETEAPYERTGPALRPRPPDAGAGLRLFNRHHRAWWPLDTHSVHHDASMGRRIRGRAARRALGDGHTNVWGEVLVWEPPNHLALTWHPGRSRDPAGRVDVRFIAVADGTRVELEHSGWEAFGERASAVRRAYSGPQAWGSVLDAFADLADLDDLDEPSPQSQLLDDLAAAYDAFFAQAAAGGFGPPSPGEWTAEQVVAHVAVNDDAWPPSAAAYSWAATTSAWTTPGPTTRPSWTGWSRRAAGS